MYCEMCGKTAELREVKVEQSIMKVCDVCKKFGREIIQPKFKRQRTIIEEKEEDLVVGFEKIIIKKRQVRGINQKDFSKMLNEKESLIKHLEQGRKPTLKLARKIEKFLGIKIIEKVEGNYEINRSKDEGLTLGDFIKVKRR